MKLLDDVVFPGLVWLSRNSGGNSENNPTARGQIGYAIGRENQADHSSGSNSPNDASGKHRQSRERELNVKGNTKAWEFGPKMIGWRDGLDSKAWECARGGERERRC